jgi:hypothetical protein
LHDARAWFGRLGLEGLERRRTGELSGGQAQRVALARALVASPEVLFADEPTGALDSTNSEQVMDLLVAAARDQGTTVVLVTHEARVAKPAFHFSSSRSWPPTSDTSQPRCSSNPSLAKRCNRQNSPITFSSPSGSSHPSGSSPPRCRSSDGSPALK